jgi:hypothetical protein
VPTLQSTFDRKVGTVVYSHNDITSYSGVVAQKNILSKTISRKRIYIYVWVKVKVSSLVHNVIRCPLPVNFHTALPHQMTRPYDVLDRDDGGVAALSPGGTMNGVHSSRLVRLIKACKPLYVGQGMWVFAVLWREHKDSPDLGDTKTYKQQ